MPVGLLYSTEASGGGDGGGGEGEDAGGGAFETNPHLREARNKRQTIPLLGMAQLSQDKKNPAFHRKTAKRAEGKSKEKKRKEKY